MRLDEKKVFPIFKELNEVFEIFKEYLIIDQWLRECTKISYILSYVDCPVYLEHYRRKTDGTYADLSREVSGGNAKEIMLAFLDDIHGKGNYLWCLTTLEKINNENVQLICMCESPIIGSNIGKFLLSNVFKGFIERLRSLFEGLNDCDDMSSIEERNCITNKDNYVSKILENAITKTVNIIETLYYPINLSYINGLSGEY